MKAIRKVLMYGFSMLLFFTSMAGNYCGIPARAGSHEDLKPSGVAGIRFEKTKSARLATRKPAPSKGWLEGVWEGTAYQSNTKENWTLKLTVKNRTYRIDYPSLSCGGEWKLIRMGKRTATFREKLTYGQSDCVDNVTITIQKLNRTQVAYWYVEPGQESVIGIAVLDRKLMGR